MESCVGLTDFEEEEEILWWKRASLILFCVEPTQLIEGVISQLWGTKSIYLANSFDSDLLCAGFATWLLCGIQCSWGVCICEILYLVFFQIKEGGSSILTNPEWMWLLIQPNFQKTSLLIPLPDIFIITINSRIYFRAPLLNLYSPILQNKRSCILCPIWMSLFVIHRCSSKLRSSTFISRYMEKQVLEDHLPNVIRWENITGNI